MSADSQAFLRELDKKLWTAADKLRSNLHVAKLPAGTEIQEGHGRLARVYKITSTGRLINDALEAVEKENPKLKNVPVASVYDRRTLRSRSTRHPGKDSRPNGSRTKPRKTSDGRRPTLQLQIDPANLAEPIDHIATIPFQHADLHAKEILGHGLKTSRSNSSSAFLCVFAVKNSISSMNMAICGIDFDFGKEPADTFTRDQHPGLPVEILRKSGNVELN